MIICYIDLLWGLIGTPGGPKWALKSYFQKCSVPPFYWCQNLSREKCKPNGKRISLIRLMSEEKNPKQPLKIPFSLNMVFSPKNPPPANTSLK